MSSAVLMADEQDTGNPRETDLARLIDYIRRDRFLPIPPSERNFVGDGDFVAVGVEFLRWFVHMGELAPHERVLDIGCGIGRMALPLTRYLQSGSYDGVDVAIDGIVWCADHITPAYDNFRFHRLDLAHPIYNPDGAQRTEDVRLPFEDAAFDFVFLTSVLTHLRTSEIRAYAREIRRVLAPGGRSFITAFMLNGPARQGLGEGRGALPFDGASREREIHAYADNPSAAVAFDEDFLLSIFLEFGLRRMRPPVYGRWSGRPTPGDSFQDLNLLHVQPTPDAV
jgi:SAM-dependent methyltransferase